MHKFAHLADAHLGAHREPNLRKLELETFDLTMQKCVEIGVDFVLVCGDLFHVGIPDLGVVDAALRSMQRLRREEIPIYAIYGSHDYTPNGTSVIDILNTAGILTNLFRPQFVGEKLRVPVTTDERTGAKLAGISARKIGLESRWYERLDRESLEEVGGFKVFAFHSGITELKPPDLEQMESIGVDMLPRGFDYYAGGHIHGRGEFSLEGHEKIVFPGPLFTGHGPDLEATARGEKRGFYIAEFDERLRGQRFVPMETVQGVFREYDLTGKNSVEASRWMGQDLEGVDVGGKLVVVRAWGELAGGRSSDIDFGAMRAGLAARGALHVYLNRGSVRSREVSQRLMQGMDSRDVERALFRSEAGKVKARAQRLGRERSPETAGELLGILRQPQKVGESKRDYVSRMSRSGADALGLEDVA
ncbi:MAG: DNA repair exonuclease [archaeon]|nr:MAG: DNA repair exonuclease [archaeon]